MTSWKRSGLLLTMLIAGALTACGEDEYVVPPPTGPGAAVGALRLNVGTSQTLILYNDGRITLGPLSFARPSAALTIDLLDHNGGVIASVDTTVLQVNIGSPNPVTATGGGAVSYDRITGFRGTLRGANLPSSTTLQVALFDKERRKTVFGPYPVPVLSR